MIIDLRGSSGAGKSYVAWRLLEEFHASEPVMLEPQTYYNSNKKKPKVGWYELDGGLTVLGRYEGGAGSGVEGKAQEVTRNLVLAAGLKRPFVFFEGLWPSLVIYKWFPFMDTAREAGVEWVISILDTPIEVCESRIYERNDGKEINVDATVIKNHARIQVIANKFEEKGYPTHSVPYERAFEWVVDKLREGGWRP